MVLGRHAVVGAFATLVAGAAGWSWKETPKVTYCAGEGAWEVRASCNWGAKTFLFL